MGKLGLSSRVSAEFSVVGQAPFACPEIHLFFEFLFANGRSKSMCPTTSIGMGKIKPETRRTKSIGMEKFCPTLSDAWEKLLATC